jgi:hypothetical protein
MTRLLFLGMLSLGLGGCVCLRGRRPPFSLPDAGQIQAIVVSPTFEGERQARRIVEREKLDAFVRFIHTKDSGWKPLWDTPPTLRYLVRVEGKSEDLVHFRISQGLITCGRQDKCFITAAEWIKLKDILEIPVD